MILLYILALVPILSFAQELDDLKMAKQGNSELGALIMWLRKEITETAEDKEEAEFVDDWWLTHQGLTNEGPIPTFLDNHNRGVVSQAIHQGVSCGACGQVSGVQALEARIALVSENWVPYSIQNFMNCDGRICIGTQPYRMATQVRNSNWIVPKDELLWTKSECKKWGEGKTKCLCGHKMGNYTNVLDDQFVFIGPTVPAHTEEKLKLALQTGPATTCYTRSGAKKLGASCKNGCSHANSVIGYTEDTLLIQESYGKGWGKFGNGTWETNIEGTCGEAILNKAYFTVIFYDYDRANAYYHEDEMVESELSFLEYEPGLHFTEKDLNNIGTAKNRCAFLGVYCKGVYKTSEGAFKLISSISKKGKKKKKKKNIPNLVTYFRKKQMVFYLQNDATETYLQIKMKTSDPKLVMSSNFKKAAPFFTSYGRLISYQHPQFHLVDNRLVKIEGDIKDSRNIDQSNTWALDDCNLQNRATGKSLDLKEITITKKKSRMIEYGITGNPTDMSSESQRFGVGISGKWSLISSKLGRPLLKDKKTRVQTFSQPGGKLSEAKFRWNAQQIVSSLGKPFDRNFEKDPGYFEFSGDPDNAVVPTGCKLVKNAEKASRLVLMKKKSVRMAHGVVTDANERWTLQRGQI